MRAAAFLLALSALLAAPAQAMQMEILGDQIVMGGPVLQGDFAQFKKLIDWRGFRINVVVLKDSPGGIAQEGFSIAELIRQQRLRTSVSGQCYSACALIFLGGVQRGFAAEPPPDRNFVAFHGLYFADGRLATDALAPSREWISRFTDRRIDPTLVRIWSKLENMQDAVYFFDSARFKGPQGASVFVCATERSRGQRKQTCDPIPDTDGYEHGIFTTRQLTPMPPPRR